MEVPDIALTSDSWSVSIQASFFSFHGSPDFKQFC